MGYNWRLIHGYVFPCSSMVNSCWRSWLMMANGGWWWLIQLNDGCGNDGQSAMGGPSFMDKLTWTTEDPVGKGFYMLLLHTWSRGIFINLPSSTNQTCSKQSEVFTISKKVKRGKASISKVDSLQPGELVTPRARSPRNPGPTAGHRTLRWPGLPLPAGKLGRVGRMVKLHHVW